MYQLARSLLFQLEAEHSHALALAGFRGLGCLPGRISPMRGNGIAGGPARYLGLDFVNRVGLAAGLDKDGEAIEGLARLGFGFIEVGTVTPRPQPGNPKPRLFRLTTKEALINRMGFNNHGVEEMSVRLRRLRRRDRLRGTLIGVNVGKNKDTPLAQAAVDYILCMESVYEYADYLTLNLSSPNTPGLRALQTGEALTSLLGKVSACRSRLAAKSGRRVPLLIKVAPDLMAEDVEEVADAIGRFELDGLIATNTTISRPGVAGERAADEAGGLSGAPLASMAQKTVAAFRDRLGDDVPIIGVGGIVSVTEAQAMLSAGADLLQIYTGFIYQGPGLIRQLVRG